MEQILNSNNKYEDDIEYWTKGCHLRKLQIGPPPKCWWLQERDSKWVPQEHQPIFDGPALKNKYKIESELTENLKPAGDLT